MSTDDNNTSGFIEYVELGIKGALWLAAVIVFLALCYVLAPYINWAILR